MYEFLVPWGAIGPLIFAVIGYVIGTKHRLKKPTHGLAVE